MQRFGRCEREVCLRYLELLEQKGQMDQVAGVAVVLAFVDVFETYAVLLSVLALPSWLFLKNEQSSRFKKVKKKFPTNHLRP